MFAFVSVMNLSRAIAAIPSKNRSLFRSLYLFQSSNLSTTATKPPRWPRKPKIEPPIPAPDTKGSIEAGADAPPAPKPSLPAAADWPRPAEIPWQPKVANSVHLIGSVAIPVQLDVAPDGRFWAVSVLKQEKTADFPDLWCDFALVFLIYLSLSVVDSVFRFEFFSIYIFLSSLCGNVILELNHGKGEKGIV